MDAKILDSSTVQFCIRDPSTIKPLNPDIKLAQHSKPKHGESYIQLKLKSFTTAIAPYCAQLIVDEVLEQ